MRRYPHPGVETIKITDIFFALSDPIRLTFFVALYHHGEEYTPGQMGEFAGGIPKSTVTHHNKILREAGVTRTRSEGTRCFVSLRESDLEVRFPGLVPMLVRHGDTAEAAALVASPGSGG